MNKLLITLTLISAIFCGCSTTKHTLKVAATAVPHAQMLEFIAPDLEQQGITLKIIVTDDYNMPNRALAHREIDANFFQHIPFFEQQLAAFHYPIENFGNIELEPMGIYSHKIPSLQALPDKATIAIPNDPTNEGRALMLLADHGIIELDHPGNLQATPLNIKNNPKNLKFIEIDAAMLPRSLQDVDAAAINTNYALQAHLNPLKDALILESIHSPYVNILVIHEGDDSREDLLALKKAMTSEKMKKYIETTYKGAILPAFSVD